MDRGTRKKDILIIEDKSVESIEGYVKIIEVSL